MKKWIAVIGILTVMFFGLYVYASITSSRGHKDGYYDQLEEGRLFGVYMLDDRHAWTVGADGKVFSCDGKDWKKEESVTKEDLFSVYASSPKDIWAVGVSGIMLHYDGEWRMTATGGGSGTLKSVDGFDENHIWAVGNGGVILSYDGFEWQPQDSGVTWNLNCVHALDASHVWIAGSGGILFFNGNEWSTVWETQCSGLFPGLNAIYAEDENHVWAVGSTQGGFSSSVLFYDGHAWEVVYDKYGIGIFKPPEGALEPFRAVYAYQGTIYAVSSVMKRGGVILTGDGKNWNEIQATGSFLYDISGTGEKMIAAGFHIGHDNLKNDTTYFATVFDINKLTGSDLK